MDKAKYRKAGIALLSIWVIVWVVLIRTVFLSYGGFKNLIGISIFTAIINFSFNPCLLIGAILLDWNSKNPLRKPVLVRLSVFYLILCIPVVCIFTLIRRPMNYGGGLRMIEKPLEGERK